MLNGKSSEGAHAYSGSASSLISVPGRVNLIGEHIDYHGLPVLPMAIQRRVSIEFRARSDRHVCASSSSNYGNREFVLDTQLDRSPPGDWGNYIKAAAQAVITRWGISRGINASVTSDLPAAAGLSSSSALLTGFAMALLAANGIRPSSEELMCILPEAEHFVGTRGGGMDHAAVLASRPGCALLVNFKPLQLSPISIPVEWCFIIAHSLTTASKSNAVLSEYNARRTAGMSALSKLGFASCGSAIENHSLQELTALATTPFSLSDFELRCFLHVVSEASRVQRAVTALRKSDAAAFGHLLCASHASLRDQLQVSTPALDSLVATAMQGGALGARLTGAGFGGCVIILCNAADHARIHSELVNRYYSKHREFNPRDHLFIAEPSAGALVSQ